MVKNPIVTTDAPQRDQKLGATFDQVFTRVTLAEINNKNFLRGCNFLPQGVAFSSPKEENFTTQGLRCSFGSPAFPLAFEHFEPEESLKQGCSG